MNAGVVTILAMLLGVDSHCQCKTVKVTSKRLFKGLFELAACRPAIAAWLEATVKYERKNLTVCHSHTCCLFSCYLIVGAII